MGVTDFVLERWWLLLGVMIVSFIAFAYMVSEDEREKREAFMADCRKHEPEYRCTALWRAGQPEVVPVPVVVPVGR